MSPMDLTRREFLAGAGALAVAPLLPQQQPPAAPANPRVVASLPSKPPTLWVNGTTGSDSNTRAQVAAGGGSVAWRTIYRAAKGCAPGGTPNAAEAARAGDVVSIAAGTYNIPGTNDRWGVAYNPVNAGASGNPITFQANGTVNLGWSSGSGPLIGSAGKDYITWRGFTIVEGASNYRADTGPCVFAGCSYGTLDACQITGCGLGGDNHSGVRIEGSRDGPYVSYGCVVSNCTFSNFYSGSDTNNGAGILIYTARDYVFEHNEVYDCGCGINLKHGTDLAGITRYNYIRGTSGRGIRLGADHVGSDPVRIYQNLIVRCGMGVQPGSAAALRCQCVNNTIVESGFGIYLYGIAGGAGHVIWNNIVVDSSGYAVVSESGSASSESTDVDFEHNCYHGAAGFQVNYRNLTFATWRSTYGQDSASPASFTADPLFANQSGGVYTLQAGSPARGAGIDVLDLQGRGTSQPVACGCYVTGSETIGRMNRV